MLRNKPKVCVIDIETTGLNPLDNIVTTICAKYGRVRYMDVIESAAEEKGLLDTFYTWMLNNLPIQTTLVSKNGKQFDFPFLTTRAMANNIMNDYTIWNHIDLQEVTRSRVSLESMLDILNLPNKSDKGFNAVKMWYDKEYVELLDYCYRDVVVTEKLFDKFYKNGNIKLVKGEYSWRK